MKLMARKLSDKKSGREIQVQLRQAENWEDMLELCGLSKHNDESKAAELACALFNGDYAVKFQAANRDDLGGASEAELDTVIANLHKVASESFTFDGRGPRKPKEPKTVQVQEKKTYTAAELDEILAKVGAKRAAV